MTTTVQSQVDDLEKRRQELSCELASIGEMRQAPWWSVTASAASRIAIAPSRAQWDTGRVFR